LSATPPLPQPATPATGQATNQPVAAALTDPAALIKLARDELSAKRVSAALETLDRYRSLYPYVGDEVFYLYALAYEQDTPLRDIKKAYENYRRVRDEFPRSQFWRQSADRVAYLERHYPGLR
jgi:outer membrane protein assembly factor BamD (BamD/ComL family)